MILSLFWLVCSLPVVTAGAASAALYDAAVHGIRRDEAGAYVRFFRTFRRELKTAVLAVLPWEAAAALVLWGGRYIGTAIQDPAPVLAATAVFALGLFFILGVASWMFPLLSRFEFSISALHRTACQFWIVHLPTSFLLTLLLAGSVWVCFRFLYPVFFIPCTQVLLASFLIERAFKKHLPDSQGK